jgi:hypothetical protein
LLETMILPPRQGSVDVADYNQVAEKTSRENSCADGKLQLSSRLDMLRCEFFGALHP